MLEWNIECLYRAPLLPDITWQNISMRNWHGGRDFNEQEVAWTSSNSFHLQSTDQDSTIYTVYWKVEKKPTNFVKVASRSSLKLHRLLTFIEQKKRAYVISHRTYRIIGIDSSELLIGSRSRSISFLNYVSEKESEISMVIKSLCSLVILQNWYLTVHAAHTALASLHVVSPSKADKVHWVAHGVQWNSRVHFSLNKHHRQRWRLAARRDYQRLYTEVALRNLFSLVHIIATSRI